MAEKPDKGPDKKEAKVIRKPSAQERSIATEIYFYDYYWDLLTYLGQRKKRLEMFQGSVRENKWTKEEEEKEWKKYCTKESAYLRKRRTRLRFAEFQVLAQIGKGGYGEVFLAQKKDTKEVCALKRMKKKSLMVQDEVYHIRNERNVLTATDSAWLVRLLYSFQDDVYVYLAMEYVPGGDLRTLLNGSGVLHEHHARFYMMEMVMCVAALHRLGFIHRDLKPENFLIDEKGHMKLTDFGLAKGNVSTEYRDKMKKKLENIKDKKLVRYSSIEKRNMYQTIRTEDRTRAFSLVGSPDYMAPEMLMNEGYDLLVDYWSIGCIFFEFLAAFPPFGAPTIDEIWVNVYHWQEVLERPTYSGGDSEFNMSNDAWDLIQKLIADKTKRWHSPSQIQQHPWIKGADWSKVREMAPPFVPDLSGELDTHYFDDFSNPDDMAKYDTMLNDDTRDAPQGKGHHSNDAAGGRNLWVGWTYRSRDNRFGHFDQNTLKLAQEGMPLPEHDGDSLL
eukprot:comp12009_c0_seq1/m.6699 comp12009_c0_seq1/g.6699  ORF comp12009_c0_seq1/g.6699 comp12009_c0_seq1/m.6699 type:complete len:502 (-) comp12009_c0_seq1:268-1773(-)